MYNFLTFWWWTKFVKEYQQIRKLRSLKDVPHEWAGKIIGPPNQKCLIIAEKVLRVLHKEDLHPDRIISSGEGGVAFCWLPPHKPDFAGLEVINNEQNLIISIVGPNRKDYFAEFAENNLSIYLEKIRSFITGEK